VVPCRRSTVTSAAAPGQHDSVLGWTCVQKQTTKSVAAVAISWKKVKKSNFSVVVVFKTKSAAVSISWKKSESQIFTKTTNDHHTHMDSSQ
jgi:hypothetical protein